MRLRACGLCTCVRTAALQHALPAAAQPVRACVAGPQGDGARSVSAEQGAAFARAHGCMYRETSAKADSGGVFEGCYDALIWGLVCTILDTPGLTRRGRGGTGDGGLELGERRRRHGPGGCC